MHYPPAHGFSIYADGDPDLPHTEAYAARAITLPMYAHMTEADQGLVIDALLAA
jgi:dTDP-4-amino-4,6-dideoxygalactose transaminase